MGSGDCQIFVPLTQTFTGKHNSQTELSASIRGMLVFKRYSFSRSSLTRSLWYSGSALVVVSWRTFWQQTTAPQFEMRRPKDCSSLLANNGPVSVSAKWKTRARKVIPEHTRKNEKSDGQIQFSSLILKIFNIAICNIKTYVSSGGSLGHRTWFIRKESRWVRSRYQFTAFVLMSLIFQVCWHLAI